MSSEIVLQESRSLAVSPLQKKSIAEIKQDDAYRKELIKCMVKGDPGTGAHYGKLPGVKGNFVHKDGVQFIADAYYLGYGDPIVSKDPRILTLPSGENIEHFDITAKVPIYNRATGDVLTVGVGSCSTLEEKYRYRGEERSCPNCGAKAIIKGQSQYGGGWVCYRKKDGCGEKFNDGDTRIEGQPVGKTENLNPTNVLDTVIAMAVKRARGRNTLDVTGMNRYFQLPPDLTDQGPSYDGSLQEESPNAPPERTPPRQKQEQPQDDHGDQPSNGKKYPPKVPPTPQALDEFENELIAAVGPENVSTWLSDSTKGYGDISSISQITSEGQLKVLKGKLRK